MDTFFRFFLGKGTLSLLMCAPGLQLRANDEGSAAGCAPARSAGTYFPLRSASLDALQRKLRERCTFEGLRFHALHATSLTLLGKMVDPMMLARISWSVDLAELAISCDQESAEAIVHTGHIKALGFCGT